VGSIAPVLVARAVRADRAEVRVLRRKREGNALVNMLCWDGSCKSSG
jgi:hypothetical protein